jgi:hypothetical protein
LQAQAVSHDVQIDDLARAHDAHMIFEVEDSRDALTVDSE